MRQHTVQHHDGVDVSDSRDLRLLSADGIAQIVEQVAAAVTGSGRNTLIEVRGWWNSELRLSRNRVGLSSHRRDLNVRVYRFIDGKIGRADTNQCDVASLKGVTAAAERVTKFVRAGEQANEVVPLDAPTFVSPETHIWSEATFTLPAEQQAAVAAQLATSSEAKGMLAAGYVETRIGEVAVHWLGEKPSASYTRFTAARCSMTVRHPKGAGSGWAGLSSYDWSALHPSQLVSRALDKCLTSLNPVAIEPGRYTLIMEPQAVCDLFDTLVWVFRDRSFAEQVSWHPMYLGPEPALRTGRSKLGLKIVDERITLSHLPTDPVLGVLPVPGLRPIKWIDRGVLVTLSYARIPYALPELTENLGQEWRPSYKIEGGNSSVEKMITETERGLLVTRFSTITGLDQSSALVTGLTRDGLWLIEKGKISKAVKNMRFTESMLFALNQLDSLGESVPVYRPVDNPYNPALTPAVVPPMKVRDFSFTSMIDAV